MAQSMGTVGQEGLLSHPPWRRQGGEAIGLLLQAEDPHSSTKQTLQSKASQPTLPAPQKNTDHMLGSHHHLLPP